MRKQWLKLMASFDCRLPNVRSFYHFLSNFWIQIELFGNAVLPWKHYISCWLSLIYWSQLLSAMIWSPMLLQDTVNALSAFIKSVFVLPQVVSGTTGEFFSIIQKITALISAYFWKWKVKWQIYHKKACSVIF